MIRDLQIASPHLSLIPQSWNEIPDFAVISGLNGAGKSQLLSGINQSVASYNPRRPSRPFVIPNCVAVKGKVKFVDSNFQPGDLGAGGDGMGAALEKEKSNLINMLRGTQGVSANMRPLIAEIQGAFTKPVEEHSTED